MTESSIKEAETRVKKIGNEIVDILIKEKPAIAIPALGLVVTYILRRIYNELELDDGIDTFFEMVHEFREGDPWLS